MTSHYASMRALGLALLLSVTACRPVVPTPSAPVDSPTPPEPGAAAVRPSAVPGFFTRDSAQARALEDGVILRPLLTVGDRVGEEIWAPMPDGLGAYADGDSLILHATHEIDPGDGLKGYPNALVSRLVLDLPSLAVREISYPVGPAAELERLCSATWVGPREGFGAPGLFLIGEELEEGRQLALTDDGRLKELPRMGRFAHENAVALPGVAGQIALIGLDDTRGASELYLTLAASEADLLAGRSTLHVFASDQARNVAELRPGEPIAGEFIPIPDPVAEGSGAGLQAWVDARHEPDPADRDAPPPIFPFVRLEDGDYDKRPGAGPRLYFADTGTDRDAGTSRHCGPDGDALCDPFGSLYRLDLDPGHPTGGVSLTLLTRSRGMADTWASPDNIATSPSSLMVQEDPAFDDFDRAARIHRFPLRGDGLGEPAALVELTDRGGCNPLSPCWESSGIIDLSDWLGAGHWLFDVQAHGHMDLGGVPEGGQLLLLQAPEE